MKPIAFGQVAYGLIALQTNYFERHHSYMDRLQSQVIIHLYFKA